MHRQTIQDLSRLEVCSGSCTSVFDDIRERVDRSGLGERQGKSLKRTWNQVKRSFTDDELAYLYQRIESEKST